MSKAELIKLERDILMDSLYDMRTLASPQTEGSSRRKLERVRGRITATLAACDVLGREINDIDRRERALRDKAEAAMAAEETAVIPGPVDA